MPQILSRDPGWLAQPTPGFSLFQPDSASASASNSTSANKLRSASPDAKYEGALRRIAHRGTEIFVAVGNELRWSELGLLRDAGEEYWSKKNASSTFAEQLEHGEGQKAWRVLKTPVSRPITQLSISPSGTYLAILTTHTIHISILPSSTHLLPHEPTPLRLKTFQLGPTAHVLEQSPLVSALWHPLSPPNTDCLLTATHDASLRLWELDPQNRASFDEPALALDLRKLANATSTASDFSASKYGANRGFSPDDVEMQIAGVCFGGTGAEDEHGWASMTLWVAMTEGDVYALCPFLPSKWRAPATLLPSLSTSVLEKSQALKKDADISDSERRAVEQQSKWLAQIDAQEPLILTSDNDFEGDSPVEIYSRPGGDRLHAIPKLQGPFPLTPAPDFGEITAIHVIAPRLDDAALYNDSDYENDDWNADDAGSGLSVSIICLATTTNEVHICLSPDSVEAQWLPSKRSRAYTFDNDDDDAGKELLLFETLDLARSDDEDDGFPTFTPHPQDRYALFATHPLGVCRLDFRAWIGALEDEITAGEDSGAGFRLNVLLDSSHTVGNQVVEIPASRAEGGGGGGGGGVNAALAIEEPGYGLLVLTTILATNAPYATLLDTSSPPPHPYAPDAPAPASTAAIPALPAPEPRAPYRPATAFSTPAYNPTYLPHILTRTHRARDAGPLATSPAAAAQQKQSIRFTPATLQFMTEAHRVLSTNTHEMGAAAAELFRVCERMRVELASQVGRVGELAQRVDLVTDGDEEARDGGEGDGRAKLEGRIEGARERNKDLSARVEALRRKMGRLGAAGGARAGVVLSARELAFGEEVGRVGRSVLGHAAAGAGQDGTDEGREAATSALASSSPAPSLASRFAAVQTLQRQLVAQANALAAKVSPSSPDAAAGVAGETSKSPSMTTTTATPSAVGGAFRRQKLAQVMELLERETALVEGVMERLRRLQGV